VRAAQSGAKFAGFGGVYEPELIRKYVGLGMRMILAGNDVGLLFAAAKERSAFVRGCAT
jgi:2-keto-3-deoxy-L-rhamnonate aldolase RhmA